MSALCLLVFAPRAQAEWSLRQSVEVTPQYRKFQQEGMTPLKEVWDVFGMGSVHAQWSADKWFAEIKPEVRAVASRGVLDPVPAGLSVQTGRRVLNTRRMLTREGDGEAYFDFDRLNLRYSYEQGDLFAGRKPLSLGVLRFFPVWNKLTLPLVFQPGPEWIENPDLVGATYASGRYSHRLFASRGTHAQADDLVLLETRFSGEGLDVQTLVGSWWQHTAAGVAGAFDVASSTVRFETLWLGRFRQEKAQGQFGLGFERALNEKWTLVAEALYQTSGVTDMRNLLTPPNRFMVLSGRFYLLPHLSYLVHPLWTLRMGMLANPADHPSYVWLGGFDHSVTDNTTLALKLKLPFGSKRGEFGSERIVDLFGRKLGASATALLQLQSTF